MLDKPQLKTFVERLMQNYRVIAPVQRTGELRFDEVEAADEVVLDYRNTTKAPKDVFFPQVERMMLFEQKLNAFAEVRGVPLDTTPTVLLGLRPCDARAVLLFDRVFIQSKYVDPYYKARRDNTVIFSLACDRPRQTCFCHALGSGPYDQAGADVMLRDAGHAYLVEPISERGAEVVGKLSLPAADRAHLDAAARIEEQARARLSAMGPVVGIEEMLQGLFDSKIWAEVSEKCLACGTCTYACPGCHCFNIEDRLMARGGERVRAWDGCMYPWFTLHASGHNPRPDQAARWRQRTMHKFEYLPHNVGAYGCVGCGRCILICPVRLDIRQVIERVRQERAAKVEA